MHYNGVIVEINSDNAEILVCRSVCGSDIPGSLLQYYCVTHLYENITQLCNHFATFMLYPTMQYCYSVIV